MDEIDTITIVEVVNEWWIFFWMCVVLVFDLSFFKYNLFQWYE